MARNAHVSIYQYVERVVKLPMMRPRGFGYVRNRPIFKLGMKIKLRGGKHKEKISCTYQAACCALGQCEGGLVFHRHQPL